MLAFLVAVSNNFLWNRRWTFGLRGGRKRFQAARFFVVSIVTFLITLGVLTALVEGAGMAELPRAGDRGDLRPAAQLPRPEALELPLLMRRAAVLAALAAVLALAGAGAARAAGGSAGSAPPPRLTTHRSRRRTR